jgi:hypothetical protein
MFHIYKGKYLQILQLVTYRGAEIVRREAFQQRDWKQYVTYTISPIKANVNMIINEY